jgi:multiple sugar transport system ATP-binding protein
MADRIVVLHDGVVEQIGTPLELYDRPGNTFVAGFIGSPSMNFFKGKVAVNGKATFVGDHGVTWPLASPPANADGRPAILGVRPEHIHINPGGVPAEVVVVEPTGSETQVVVKSGDREMICLFRERIAAQPGDKIPILPDPGVTHLFDAATGQRL